MEHGVQRTSRYDADRARAWHLSILIGQGLAAWSAHDAQDGTPHAMAWGPGMEALRHKSMPRQPVSVSYVGLPQWSTLVPEGALAPGSGAKHLTLTHGGMPSGAMREEALPDLGAVCIYTHDDRDERQVMERHPNARPLPMQALMARTAQRMADGGPLLLLHRGQERLDAAVHDRGRLLLSNTYPVRAANDVLYFALLALETCGLSPFTTRLVAGGTHLHIGERELLGRYFKELAADQDTFWADVREGGQAPAGRWMALLEQFACVS